MGWIQELRHRIAEGDSQSKASSEDRFNEAAKQRWIELGNELKADVAEFNTHGQGAAFDQKNDNQYRVSNSASGLELNITANFIDHIVRYEYRALNRQSAGAPEGGILSMRQSRRGGVEFYSADERLTSEETRQVLLEPVLFPPQKAA